MTRCRNCRHSIDTYQGGWYHVSTGAARCKDDASFRFAEPEDTRERALETLRSQGKLDQNWHQM